MSSITQEPLIANFLSLTNMNNYGKQKEENHQTLLLRDSKLRQFKC